MEKTNIKSIFIAAGMGSRLAPYTDDCPKCMLPLNGKPIIANNVEHFLANGVKEVNVVVGYQKDKVVIDGAKKFENKDFQNNNILFSLMCAKSVFEEAIEDKSDLLISYSDIIYSGEIVKKVVDCPGDIAISVDLGWLKLYEGRSDHPVSEAEKVQLTSENLALKLGKQIPQVAELKMGEFIGLLKLTPMGAEKWLSHFNKLSSSLEPTDSFQGSKEFRKSYLTHFIQDMIDMGEKVTCSTFDGGWMEFDTAQDYEKLLETYRR